MDKIVLIKDILNFLDEKGEDYVFIGNLEECIDGFSSITNYKEESLTWIKNSKNVPDKFDFKKVKLAVIQIEDNIETRNQIKCRDSKRIFFGILAAFFDNITSVRNIGYGTYISPNVKLGENVIIGHNCTLDGDIAIGNGTRIGNNVNIVNRTNIGNNCIIQSLTTIGEDGFGYFEKDNKKTMVRHFGGVVIEDDVFIGSHVNIARGTIDDTIIKRGVKIAPSSHIGHNVFIDEDTAVICSQVFGSVKIGRNSYISSCTVRNQCNVGENTVIGMGSIVTKDVENNVVAMGIPAKIRKKNL